MHDAPGAWRIVKGYAMVQAVALLLLPGVWGANLASVRPGDPLGLRGWPEQVADVYSTGPYWVFAAVITAAVFTLQVVTLAAVWRPVPPLSRPARLWLGAIAPGLAVFPLLLCGLMIVAAGFIAFDVRWRPPDPTGPPVIMVMISVVGVMLALWGVGVLLARWVMARQWARGRLHEDALACVGRVLLWMIAAMALVAVPLDILARMEQAYHSQMTAQPVTLLGLMTLTVLGPTVLLLRMGRARAAWYAARCPACGYERAGAADVVRCPECGHGWGGAAGAGEQSAP